MGVGSIRVGSDDLRVTSDPDNFNSSFLHRSFLNLTVKKIMEMGPLVIKFCRLALGDPVIMTHRVHASARVHTAAIFCVLFKLEDRK